MQYSMQRRNLEQVRGLLHHGDPSRELLKHKSSDRDHGQTAILNLRGLHRHLVAADLVKVQRIEAQVSWHIPFEEINGRVRVSRQ